LKNINIKVCGFTADNDAPLLLCTCIIWTPGERKKNAEQSVAA